MGGLAFVDLMIAGFEMLRAVTPAAAMVLALVLWFRLFAAGAWLRRAGYERHALYFEFVVADTGIVSAVVLMHWVEERLGGAPLRQFFVDMRLLEGPTPATIAGASIALLSVYFAVALIAGSIADFFGERSQPLISSMRPRTAGERFVWVSAVSPAAGFSEELLFRGLFLWAAFDLGADPTIAVFLTSVAFGLGHSAYGLTWTVGTSVLGAASAIAVLWSGSLWPAIVAHTLYDMTVYYIFADDDAAETNEGAPAPAGFMCGLAPPR